MQTLIASSHIHSSNVCLPRSLQNRRTFDNADEQQNKHILWLFWNLMSFVKMHRKITNILYKAIKLPLYICTVIAINILKGFSSLLCKNKSNSATYMAVTYANLRLSCGGMHTSGVRTRFRVKNQSIQVLKFYHLFLRRCTPKGYSKIILFNVKQVSFGERGRVRTLPFSEK